MGAPYSGLEVASFMTCSKGYMGECGIRGGYAEIVNMDTSVMAMLPRRSEPQRAVQGTCKHGCMMCSGE